MMAFRACAARVLRAGAARRRYSAIPTQHVTARQEDYSAWYQDVLREAQLVDSSPVRGCFVLMPRGMALWDRLRADLDARISDTGVLNASFPLLVPLSFLSREADHVEGFAKECAVVTHTRLHARADGAGVEPDPSAVLSEPLVVRPTSETVVWDSFRRWIRTESDLPVLVNQWANVLRWERRTRPFLRTSEFHWQEGHTAHATREEAVGRARRMQGVYRDTIRRCLAIPTILGQKSPSERFAGAEETLTLEAMMQDGWALQAGTSHFLGTAFADAFGVSFSDAAGESRPVWATSWGVSTRLLGALVMSHSDDVGFVSPPAVAPTQVEVVPLGKGGALERAEAAARSLVADLRAGGLRAAVDLEAHALSGPGGEASAAGRVRGSLGKRRFASERRGTPLRVEIGAREADSGFASVRPRVALEEGALEAVIAQLAAGAAAGAESGGGDVTMSERAAGVSGSAAARAAAAAELERGGGDVTVALGAGPEGAVPAVRAALELVHASLLLRSERRLASRTARVRSYEELQRLAAPLAAVGDDGEAGGAGGKAVSLDGPAFFDAPWFDDAEAERRVKEETRLTIRCLDGLGRPQQGDVCILSGKPATHRAIFARAY